MRNQISLWRKLSENNTQYLMEFDLPGVAPENVRVQVTNNVLTITAERNEKKETDELGRHVSEVISNKYIKTFSLPMPIDEKLVTATFENGVLKVTVLKTAAADAKRAEAA